MYSWLLVKGAIDYRLSELKDPLTMGNRPIIKRAWILEATQLLRDRAMLRTLGILGSSPNASLND